MKEKSNSITVTSPEGLPHLKTVAVNYERKFNLGNYNSATIGFTAWADIAEEDDLDAATEAMWEYAKAQVKAQALPLIKGEKEKPAQPAGNGGQSKKKAAQEKPAQSEQAQDTGEGGRFEDYTGIKEQPLEMITIKPQGKYEFEVTGAQYPLKDGRGPGIVSTLFSPDCFTEKFTKEMLENPAVLTQEVLGVLLVTYGKKGKYWDVLSIRPA